MNETEIRDRIRGALGDSRYPPQLTSRIGSHLGDPPRPEGHPLLLSGVALILAIAIIGTLVFARLESGSHRITPAASPHASSTPAATQPAQASSALPQADLDRAQLTGAGDLVTPFNLTSTKGDRTVTLIGAYADSSRIVLFFRTLPTAGFPNVSVYDDTGFLNASSSAGPASFGDDFFVLDTGPHPGSDGTAHLTATIDTFDSATPGSVQMERGPWTFNFRLPLAGSTRLALNPALTSVGHWKFTVEAMELTPTQIHFQAVIDGAAVEDVKNDTVTLLDAAGGQVQPVTWSAATTVPKSQIGSVPPRSTRVNISWNRPPIASKYTLVIQGGGATYRGQLSVPAPAPASGGKKGAPPAPTDFPVASEQLGIDGAFSAGILSGHPTACGSGTGPDGTVFAFATYFQVDQAWYLIAFTTDPTVGQYRGPGTYPVKATIYPLGGAPIFDGTARLTVTSDKRPGPQTGSVSGTLTWTGAATHPITVTVGGNWNCTWSQQLGPG